MLQALTFEPVGEDLWAVLSELKERTAPGGGPWCPPQDAAAVSRCIVDRTDGLGTNLQAVIRFVRLAALASPRGYIGFCYPKRLHRDVFRAAVEEAADAGRLQPQSVAADSNGVRLLEPGMAAGGDGGGFEIAFAQMPRLAALLDVLHNTLGYAEVAALLRPIAEGRERPIPAAETGRALRSRLNAWLKPRLESAHRRNQAKAIQAFLAAQGALSPDKIGDEVILSFWRDRIEREPGGTEDDSGFRLYRSAAKLVLRYRRALADAMTALAADRADGTLLDRIAEAGAEAASPWRSPVAELSCPPANRIKWLTERELVQLANYLGKPDLPSGGQAASAPREEDACERAGSGQQLKGALMEGEPFDLRFLRTLLRADVFGDAQARITGRLRLRSAPGEAIGAALQDVNKDAYCNTASGYSDIRTLIRREMLAVLHILGGKGDAMAALLLEPLTGRRTPIFAAMDRLGPGTDGTGQKEEQGEDDVQALSAAGAALERLFQDCGPRGPRMQDLIQQARKARLQIHRKGFRTEDEADAAMLEAMRHSVPALIRLANELERLRLKLQTPELENAAAEDLQIFSHMFQRAYQREQDRPASASS